MKKFLRIMLLILVLGAAIFAVIIALQPVPARVAEVLVEGWGGEQALQARVRLIEPSGFTKVSALGIEEQRVDIVADFVADPGPLGDGYRVKARLVVW